MKVYFSWKTNKQEDGTFQGVVTKNTTLKTPVDGRFVKSEVIATYHKNTRAKAKSAAIKAVRYHKSTINK